MSGFVIDARKEKASFDRVSRRQGERDRIPDSPRQGRDPRPRRRECIDEPSSSSSKNSIGRRCSSSWKDVLPLLCLPFLPFFFTLVYVRLGHCSILANFCHFRWCRNRYRSRATSVIRIDEKRSRLIWLLEDWHVRDDVSPCGPTVHYSFSRRRLRGTDTYI